MAKIGVQMMIFRELIAKEGVYEVMKRIKEIGFSVVEVSQVQMTPENVEGLRKACEDFNMDIAALSASLEAMMPGMESLTTDFDKIVADCKTLNCNYLRIGMMPFQYLTSKEACLDFAKRCDEVAEKLAEHGIQLYYHTHHAEFVKYDGKYLLDILRDSTNKLGFEIDVHWVQRGGLNPVEFLKTYKGRLELVHLKDYRIATPNFEGIDPKDFMKFFAAFVNIVQFAEIGEGNLDMPAIIDSSIEAGANYFIIEQDDTYGVDPFECLTTSRNNLVKMGYESWF